MRAAGLYLDQMVDCVVIAELRGLRQIALAHWSKDDQKEIAGAAAAEINGKQPQY